MKFVKGMMLGTLISAGAIMLYTETSSSNKRKVMKMGKQLAKKMGIM